MESAVTPTELQEVVSSALDIPLPTVSFHARRLREAGFLTKGGRGRSAPSMRTVDGARLCFAVIASESTTDSADVLHDYARIGPLERACSGRMLEHLGGAGTSALGAVETLFRNLAGGTFVAFARSVDPRADVMEGMFVGVRLRGAARTVSIGFSDSGLLGQCVFMEGGAIPRRGVERMHRVPGSALIEIASAFNRPK